MMTYEERKEKFFCALDELNSGERVALRRAVGTRLADANGRALQAFFKCLPRDIGLPQEEKWYAAACFHCMWEETDREALTQILKTFLIDESVSNSTRQRMVQILDQKWDEDGFLLTKLGRFLKMVKQRGGAVDCSALLDDFLAWNREDQKVQRKWAKIFSEVDGEKNKKKE